MDCPTCSKPLVPSEYEGVRVQQCQGCSGYLAARNRLRLIKSSRKQTKDALEREADGERRADTEQQIRCPKCKAYRMEKRRVRVSDDDAFFLDVCPKCDHVWLDGGELARLQLKFEASAKAIDDFARREQLQNFDEQRRESLQQQIDELPERENVLHAIGKDLGLLGSAVAILVGITLTYLFGARLWSASLSLLLAVLVVWGVLFRTELSRNLRFVVVGAIVVVELAYLALPIGMWW